ncbi:MAG: hypothetical protein KDG58_01085, partial [Anaerolineae bacterium]|nr:hypothetical protein [Anaerolineae bacterium]
PGQAVACDVPSDIPWLSLDAYNGSNGGGTNTGLTVTFDSTGLAPDVYTGSLCVTSNDPDPGPGNGTDLVIVPVTLTVSPPTAVALTDLAADNGDQPFAATTAAVSAFLAAALTAVFVTSRRRRHQR